MNILALSSAQLSRAADIQESLESLRRELDSCLNGRPAPASGVFPAKDSPSERRSLAMKAAWARRRAASAPIAAARADAPRQRKPWSAAARARMAQIQRERWAQIHAANARQ